MNTNAYSALRLAAQYVRQFRDKIFVIKLGGEVLADPGACRVVCEQLAVLSSFSIHLVIVHGGGSDLDRLCTALDIPIEKVAGRRVTTPAVLDAAKMTFTGKTHVDLLAELRAAGIRAVGLSGIDGALLSARKRPPRRIADDDESAARTVDFGLVGEIEAVDPELLSHLIKARFVPVIAPLAGNDAGEIYNVNADTIAAEVAGALNAEKLFFLMPAPGLLEDVNDAATLIPYTSLDRLAEMEQSGRLRGGMRPKFAAAQAALEHGVAGVHLVSGMLPDALLIEIFTNEGSGTMIVNDLDPAAANTIL